MAETMTKGEREDIQRLIRQREKVLKSAAKQRSAELLADFENQMAAEYHIGDDPVWEELAKAAEIEVGKIKVKLAARCRELGIPAQFAPKLSLNWQHKGWSNALEERVKELRTSAKAEIEALERKAIVQIETASVDAQTQIAIAGLTSDAARIFVQQLPTVETLMPLISYQQLAGEADPSPVEQLATPNAIRQRRYREKQKALRDAAVTQAITSRNEDDTEAPE